MNTRSLLVGTLLASLVTLAAATGGASPPALRAYEGAGTLVASVNLLNGELTLVDNGAVLCRDVDADGYLESGRGGVCIPFAEMAGDSIRVADDAVAPENLAFQVCVDANGDGVCGGGGGEGGSPIVNLPGSGCRDVIFFSHSSQGWNANPLAVHPEWAEAYWSACGGLGFPGFVVILCGGLHDPGQNGSPHLHDVTTGTVTSDLGGTHGGDYCGAPTAAKAYVVA